MKIISTLILTCFALTLCAQDLDWACTATNIDYNFLITGPDSTILVGAVQEKNPNQDLLAQIFREDGTELDTYWNDRIISYTRTGKINWVYSLEAKEMELKGLALDAHNRIALLVLDKSEKFNGADIPMSEDDGDYEDGDEAIPAREDEQEQEEQPAEETEYESEYYLLYLDKKGNLTETVHCTSFAYGLEVFDFKMHPNHGFVLSGFLEKDLVAKNIPDVRAGARGANVVMAFTPQGEAVWADVINFRGNEDSRQGCYLSVAPDGTVYLGGHYYGGISYDHDRLRKLTPISYKEHVSGNFTTAEVFVTCYEPGGRIQWLKTSSNNSDFNALQATTRGVYLAYRILGGDDTTFGAPINLGDKVSVIAFLNRSGKAEWTLPVGGETKSLALDKQEDLLLLGECRQQPETLLVTGNEPNYRFSDRDYFFLARFTGKKLNRVEPASVLVETGPAFLLLPSGNNQYYITSHARCHDNLPLNVNDDAFKLKDCDSPYNIAFIGKLKMK